MMKPILGLVFLFFGLLILLQSVGMMASSYDLWTIFFSLVLIIFGLKLMIKKGGMHCCCCQGQEGKQAQ